MSTSQVAEITGVSLATMKKKFLLLFYGISLEQLNG
jgi:hypothetical protein